MEKNIKHKEKSETAFAGWGRGCAIVEEIKCQQCAWVGTKVKERYSKGRRKRKAGKHESGYQKCLIEAKSSNSGA